MKKKEIIEDLDAIIKTIDDSGKFQGKHPSYEMSPDTLYEWAVTLQSIRTQIDTHLLDRGK